MSRRNARAAWDAMEGCAKLWTGYVLETGGRGATSDAHELEPQCTAACMRVCMSVSFVHVDTYTTPGTPLLTDLCLWLCAGYHLGQLLGQLP